MNRIYFGETIPITKKNDVQVLFNGKSLEDYEEEDQSDKMEFSDEPPECEMCPMRNSRRCGNCPVR